MQNGIAVDMNPYVEADPEYAKELGEDALEFGRNWEDGGLYNISYGRQSIGYFYNKEMFEEAGITPATTWDEWMSNLETLKTLAFVPLPFQHDRRELLDNEPDSFLDHRHQRRGRQRVHEYQRLYSRL